MSSIAENIKRIRATLPENVTLVCVSKYHTEQEILEAYNCGERDFAESRVQELIVKHQNLPKDIKWHFIGHLQTNKVKQLLPIVHLIHSVDSFSLLECIQHYARELGLRPKVLLEVNISGEEQKYGFTAYEISEAVKSNSRKYVERFFELMGSMDSDEIYHYVSSYEEFGSYMKDVDIVGLMGMAKDTNDKRVIDCQFAELQQLYQEIQEDRCFTSHTSGFNILSMGMTHDYELALKRGSNMVRIGSGIFG